MLCNELLSKFVETGHFQPGERDVSIVFGVVVELMPRTSDPTAFVGLCMAALSSTSPPKGLCQCIELRFSFAVEWVGRCWAGLTNIA